MKKKILSVILAALMFTGAETLTLSLPEMTTVVSAATSVTAMNRTGTVNTSSGNLNVRKSASTSSAILGKLAKGTTVTIVGKTTDGKWYKIKYNSGYGFVSSDYVKLNPVNTPTTNVSQARKDIIARAQAMVDMKWTTPKQFSGWKGKTTFKTGTTYTGMPYTQGTQATSPTDFKNKIKNYSGSLTLTSPQTQPRFGNDCSGFVSAAWGVSRHTTSTLPSIATEINYNDLQPGDILNHAGDHTFIFKKWADAGKTKMVVLEQTPPHAIETTKTVSACKARPYKALRWNKLK